MNFILIKKANKFLQKKKANKYNILGCPEAEKKRYIHIYSVCLLHQICRNE